MVSIIKTLHMHAASGTDEEDSVQACGAVREGVSPEGEG